MHASLRMRRIEEELGLAVFLLNGVVACNDHLAEGLVIGETVVEKGIVGDVSTQ